MQDILDECKNSAAMTMGTSDVLLTPIEVITPKIVRNLTQLDFDIVRYALP
jgi:hypothetical protein